MAETLAEIIDNSFCIDLHDGLEPAEAASNAVIAMRFVAGERNREFEGINIEEVERVLQDYYAKELVY
ncbi:hypothetical protein [Bradyrhizobium sp. CCBAU 53380]|uniref:hypothetical protein n=1 Tax=Bradyrhizobium sp. CCBAU 53380 TaxID=1325117 RepID=UPI0023042CB6|nr:hypothetical protein [Bradyrhizobium sp. CCBAU 53380]MDA9420990.1 hypothetical protein [Bradyrhizobium sp. CCBAU 53380]